MKTRREIVSAARQAAAAIRNLSSGLTGLGDPDTDQDAARSLILHYGAALALSWVLGGEFHPSNMERITPPGGMADLLALQRLAPMFFEGE